MPDPAREKRIEMYEGISNVTAYTSLFSSPIIKTISEVVSFGTTVLANVERAIDGIKKISKDLNDQVAYGANTLYTKYAGAVVESARSFNELKERQQGVLSQNQLCIDITRAYWQELQGLQDANGRISEADRRRAEFLIGTLNPIIGNSLSLMDDNTLSIVGGTSAVDANIDSLEAQSKTLAEMPVRIQASMNAEQEWSQQAEISEQLDNKQNLLKNLSAQYDSIVASQGKNSESARQLADEMILLNNDIRFLGESYEASKFVTDDYYSSAINGSDILVEKTTDNNGLLKEANLGLVEDYQQMTESTGFSWDTLKEKILVAGESILADTTTQGDLLASEMAADADGMLTHFDELNPKLNESAIGSMTSYMGGMESLIPGLTVVTSQASDAVSGTMRNKMRPGSKDSPMYQIGSGVVDDLGSGMEDQSDPVVDIASELMQDIDGTRSKVDFLTLALNLMDGFYNGIKQKRNTVLEYVKSVMSGIAIAARITLGINSPSKVFAEIGTSIPEGMEVGIQKKFSSMENALQTDLVGLASRMENAVQVEMLKNSLGSFSVYSEAATHLAGGHENNGVARINLDSQANLYLDGEKVATAVNRQNAIRRLQYGM